MIMPKLLDAVLSIILISISSVASAGPEDLCPELKVERQLLKNGFHRDLITRVSIQGFAEQVNSCRIVLRESIPSGLFVDPYQLSSLQQQNLTEAVLLTSVDVEAPEYLSTAHTALVYMRPDDTCSNCYISTVPVHARYHRPSSHTHQVSVHLQNPQLLIRCSKEFLQSGCPNHLLVEAPCGTFNGKQFQWLDVPYTMVKENPVVQVPVGIAQHSPAVCIVTVAVTLICTGMLLTAISKHKQKCL
ncbi:phosphatidylinositol-glycan biosynthesis class X protein [Hyperolius riggenbachi]|uniref:phosphatidylinositol-glycan biosynthesis class X protein n=1 Tax=Hyperolius riggenbachi TaxID=752182 RepID=UPI0035A26D31